MLGFVCVASGGAEGNRTPVRKQLDKTFSGCSLLFTFPHPIGNKHSMGLGSFMMHGALKALRTHVLYSDHTRARLVDLPGRMGALIRQPEQQFCCQLILKSTRFNAVRRRGPLIQPHYPRRNQYGPMGKWDGWHPTIENIRNGRRDRAASSVLQELRRYAQR